MISVVYTTETSSFREAIVLTLPQGICNVSGAALVTIFGHRIKHWKLTLNISVFIMVLFGALQVCPPKCIVCSSQ